MSSLFEGLRVICSLLCIPSWALQVHAQLACHFTSFSRAYLPKHMHAPTMCQYIGASSILNFPAFTYGLGDTAGTQISYFISPHAQNTVRAAVFYIVDDEDNGVGVGVAVPQL